MTSRCASFLLIALLLLSVVFVPMSALAQAPGGQAPAAKAAATTANTVVTEGLHVEKKLIDLPREALAHVNTATGEIPDAGDARAIIDNTVVKSTSADLVKALPDANDFYCIIHVLRWTITDNTDPKTKADSNRAAEASTSDKWYVYHGGHWSQDDFASNNRVFGVHRVWLMYIHLN